MENHKKTKNNAREEHSSQKISNNTWTIHDQEVSAFANQPDKVFKFFSSTTILQNEDEIREFLKASFPLDPLIKKIKIKKSTHNLVFIWSPEKYRKFQWNASKLSKKY